MLALAALLALAAPAVAASRPAPRALAALVGGTVADSSVTSAALALGCTLDDSACLDQVARAQRASELVFGSIRVGDDARLFVKITRYLPGVERRERTFVIDADGAASAARQLQRSAREMFDLAPADAAQDLQHEARSDRAAPVDASSRSEPELAPRRPRPRASRASRSDEPPLLDPDRDRVATPAPGISGATWATLGLGGAAAAGGAGLLAASYALRDDVARAPRNTQDDFRRLRALERAGMLRAQAGGILLAVGAATVVVGALRAVAQRDRRPPPDRSVALVPTAGGAAIVLSVGIP
jgi:hypothetical protein